MRRVNFTFITLDKEHHLGRCNTSFFAYALKERILSRSSNTSNTIVQISNGIESREPNFVFGHILMHHTTFEEPDGVFPVFIYVYIYIIKYVAYTYKSFTFFPLRET